MLARSPGKLIRAPFFFQSEKPIIVAPVDDLLIFGPKGGLEQPARKLEELRNAGVDAILTFCGNLMRNPTAFTGIGRIVNLSGSTIRASHTDKVELHSIEHALRVGASAVAFHINIMSQHAPKMLSSASRIIAEADRFGLPTLGIMYPRGETNGDDNNYDELKRSNPDGYASLVAHSVSIGVDLGFDIIKTYYTDDQATFRRVIECADGVPILIAGGPLLPYDQALNRARLAIESGAAGVSFGRNLFGRSLDLKRFVDAIRSLPRTHAA